MTFMRNESFPVHRRTRVRRYINSAVQFVRKCQVYAAGLHYNTVVNHSFMQLTFPILLIIRLAAVSVSRLLDEKLRGTTSLTSGSRIGSRRAWTRTWIRIRDYSCDRSFREANKDDLCSGSFLVSGEIDRRTKGRDLLRKTAVDLLQTNRFLPVQQIEFVRSHMPI